MDAVEDPGIETFGKNSAMEDMVKMMANVMELMRKQDALKDREKREKESDERKGRDQEMRASRCLQAVLLSRGKIDGQDVTKYLEDYKIQVEVQMVDVKIAIKKFVTVAVTSLRESIQLIIDRSIDEGSWKDFERRMKEEFQLEDSSRETHTTFLDWVNERRKNLEPQQLLREFVRKMSQQPWQDARVISLQKSTLFLRAADMGGVVTGNKHA